MEQVVDWSDYFPYEEPTRSQMTMILNIIRAESNTRIMIQNSTGGGKSIASLVGALTRKRPHEKIIIFCRTVSQISSFLREWKKIIGDEKSDAVDQIKNGQSAKIVPMIGKSKLCRMIDHTPDFPKEAVGVLCHLIPCSLHPSRNEAKFSRELAIIDSNIKLWYNPSTEMFRDTLFRKEGQCPYYFQNALLKTADIVVTTYPFISDPLLSYLLDSMEIGIQDCIFIFDEAHNLATTEKVELKIPDLQKLEDNFGSVLLLSYLRDVIGSKPRMYQSEEIAESYIWDEAEQIIALRDEQFHAVDLNVLIQPETLKFKEFLRIQKIGFLHVNQEAVIAVRVAPNEWLSTFDEAELQIYMSGTLRPINIFRSLFGFKSKVVTLDLDTNYDQNLFKSYLRYNGISSKLSRRTPENSKAIADAILTLYPESPRHVLVVFPSYGFLNLVKTTLESRIRETSAAIEIITEKPGMALAEIQQFVNYKKSKVLILGVSSGKFTEGVELVRSGKSLISLLIFAGLPFHNPEESRDNEMKIIRSLIGKYYDSDQTYRFIPIMQAISQALGRTVRSARDKGALVILDFRAEIIKKKDPQFRLREYWDLNLLQQHVNLFFKEYPTLSEVLKN